MKMRVLVVDDQKLFLESLATVLESFTEHVEVVGKALSGKSAIELVQKTDLDVVLIDIRMPSLNGIETAKLIREIKKEVKIILLTTFDDDEYIKQAMAFGVDGYILKDIEPSDLLNYLKAVYAGATVLHSTIAEKLQGNLSGQHADHMGREEMKFHIRTLTLQEKKILHLISEGYSNIEIADKLYISRQTVQNYVSGIYSKIETNDRMKIIRMFKDFNDWNF